MKHTISLIFITLVLMQSCKTKDYSEDFLPEEYWGWWSEPSTSPIDDDIGYIEIYIGHDTILYVDHLADSGAFSKQWYEEECNCIVKNPDTTLLIPKIIEKRPWKEGWEKHDVLKDFYCIEFENSGWDDGTSYSFSVWNYNGLTKNYTKLKFDDGDFFPTELYRKEKHLNN